MPATARPLILLLNQQVVYEYDRNQRLPGKQRAFLDFMDEDMEQGIELDGTFYEAPKIEQKLSYVAANLVHAHHEGNTALLKATSAYLALRAPELNELVVDENGEEFTLQLIFSEQEQSVDNSSPAEE